MKTPLTILLAALSLLGASCASQSSLGAKTANSSPTQSSIHESSALVVFSEWDRLSDSSDTTWKHHTDYSVYDTDGKLLRQVKNHNMGPDSRPVEVELPPGNYVVKARRQGAGWVSVPVSLKTGNTSEIYLDDSTKPAPTPHHTIQMIK